MPKKILNHILLGLALSLTACTRSYQTTGRVHISEKQGGYTLMRNGQPFTINGVAGQEQLALLQSIGGNTIRTYDTVDLQQILDEAHRNNLAVIVGIDLPKSTQDWFYGNQDSVKHFDTNLSHLIDKYKGHPALLLWCLGNEPIFYNFLNFSFSNAYNTFYETIKTQDPNHPVAMALANVSERAIINARLKLSGPDLYLINTFGRLHEITGDLEKVKFWWDGPYVVGEYGVDGPWETEAAPWGAALEKNSTQKAQRLAENYTRFLPLQEERCLGALAFYWGQRQEVTHTWFNFFNTSQQRSAMVYTLAELWDHPLAGNRPPTVEQLSLNGHTQPEQLFFSGGDTLSISFKATDPEGDSLRRDVALRPEDWFFEKWQAPARVAGAVVKNNNKYQLVCPQKPGPYRLFVEVKDGAKNFATLNLPFYVVSEE